MDPTEFWQENKRFVLAVLAGAIAFFVGLGVVRSTWWSEVGRTRASIARTQGDLRRPLFSAQDRDRAREQNTALLTVVGDLRGRVHFEPRAEFSVDGRAGSISNTYFAVASSVRENLLTLAGRAGLRLPESLGLPPSVTDDDEIVRYLEGLDVVDRVVHLAMRAGVERVDAIRMRLDPAILADRPLPTIERTEIEMELSGSPRPLVALLVLLQEPRDGSVLLVDEVEMKTARVKRDEATLKLTLLVVHLHGLPAAEVEL